MPETIKLEDMLFTAFEPKIAHRYIVVMSEFPSAFICSITRPNFTLNLNSCGDPLLFEPEFIEIELYDPIVPSMAQRVYEMIKENKTVLSDIELKVLGPPGDVVEHWRFEKCKLLKADFGKLTYQSTIENPSEPVKIKLTIQCGKILLEF